MWDARSAPAHAPSREVGLLIDGVFTQLSTDNDGMTPGVVDSSGTVTLTLKAGDTYGFYVNTLDNFGGRADIAITSSGTPAVPGPIAGAGLPGLLLQVAACSAVATEAEGGSVIARLANEKSPGLCRGFCLWMSEFGATLI